MKIVFVWTDCQDSDHWFPLKAQVKSGLKDHEQDLFQVHKGQEGWANGFHSLVHQEISVQNFVFQFFSQAGIAVQSSQLVLQCSLISI